MPLQRWLQGFVVHYPGGLSRKESDPVAGGAPFNCIDGDERERHWARKGKFTARLRILRPSLSMIIGAYNPHLHNGVGRWTMARQR